MSDRYGTTHALKSPPHITLQMPFRHPENKEDHLIKKLAFFAGQRTHLEIQLSGFGSFPPRVIFIDVIKTQTLDQRFFELRNFLHQEIGLTSPQQEKDRFSPHVTLATRDLKKEIFPEVWEAFRNQEFQAAFISRDLSLLKHTGKTWNVYKRFPWKEKKDGLVFEDPSSLINSPS